MLYSRNGAHPKALPQRIRLDGGYTRTALDEYPKEQLGKWGFIEAPNPPEYNPIDQVLEWSKGKWVVRDKTKEEYQQEKAEATNEKEAILQRVAELEAKEVELDDKINAVKVEAR